MTEEQVQQNYRSKYNAHVIRIATVLVFLAAGGIGVRRCWCLNRSAPTAITAPGRLKMR